MKQIMKQTVALLMGWVLCASASVMAQRITLKVNGTDRTFLEYVPKNLGKNRPMLISCHGASQDAFYMRDTQMKMGAVADTAKFLIVFPDGISNQWDISGDRDIKYIEALIDEMVRKYSIDRNRVYLSGFSMGGMLTYHAMNKIADKIAAFAPISGYPLWGSEANSSRPVPILHTQGTGVDVVSAEGVRGVLNKWIQRNHCSTTAKEIKKYKGYGHANLYIWGGGDEGVEVRLLELEGKGHWVSNDGVLTGEEIWLFCKNYSLNKTSPSVSLTSPKSGTTFTLFAPQEERVFPSITLTAEASDPNGTVEKVDFYDGSTLIASCTESPYTATLETSVSGKHTLKAVATDNDGETASATVEVSLNAPQTQYAFSQHFNEDAIIPAGWTTYDGSEERMGYSNGYTLGCRVLQFTGTRRDFNYGLYFRNMEGKPRAGYAKYGLEKTSATLSLAPGRYVLKYKICNWNQPQFSPVEVCVEARSDGEAIATQTYTPTVNIGNVASNKFSGSTQQMLEFEVKETGDYVLAFYTADTEWADCVIGQLLLTVQEYVSTDIIAPVSVSSKKDVYYNLSGQRVEHPTHGIYIRNGEKVLVR